ncbi:MAG: asparagine synthase [Proteobacteria bacterium]|nr:asparagine synthase [Pseudomonadota bacterium]
MRGDFLALVNRDLESTAFASALRTWTPALEASGWRPAWSTPAAIVMIRGPRDLPLRPITTRCGLVIGDIFARAPGVEPIQMGFDEAAFLRQCRRLSGDYWGRYVAFRWPTENRSFAVYRDPSGALDCLTWRVAGATVITSSGQLDLPAPLQPKLSLDWDRVAGFLDDPSRIAGALALQGVRAIAPGEIWYDEGQGRYIQVWTPGQFAEPQQRDEIEVKAELVRRVDQCVATCIGSASRTLVEVSGGLDSSIVSTSAAGLAPSGVGAWLNYRASNARSDERIYARAVAAQAGFVLTEAARPLAPFDVAAWEQLSSGVRPPLNALDTRRDADLARRCADLQCDQVLTGQGGDVVFFQEPTALVVADLVGAGARPGAIFAAARSVAAWTRQSVWSVLRQARAAGCKSVSGARWAPIRQRRLDATPCKAHPWLAGLEKVPPAKRLQIEAVTACQSFYGDSHTMRRAAVVHPLLAQPVIELCLGLPTPQLTRCRRDRAFAREAFAERLPPVVATRQAKGELASHYGQAVAATLGDLRPRLLDGELVRHGLLDREALDEALTAEDMILNGNAYAVLSVALVEVWAARWARGA